MDVSEIFRKDNPPGTKFLVELEVKDPDGYNNMMSCVCIASEDNKFIQNYGVSVSRVYKKEITVDGENVPIEILLESLRNQVNKLKSENNMLKGIKE